MSLVFFFVAASGQILTRKERLTSGAETVSQVSTAIAVSGKEGGEKTLHGIVE